ncbi:inhibitor of Bruton tyrosine kinase [Ciona intestinalis]
MDEVCTVKCNFGKCVDDLNHVITKATLHQVKEYIRLHCFTAVARYDNSGRTPLHVAASSGKSDIVRWICKLLSSNKCSGNVTIDSVDVESNWSALHRALYYGRIASAMELLKNGANMWLKDKAGCNSLDMIIADISPWNNKISFKRNSDISVQSITDLKNSDVSELYTWGVNENMTLAQAVQKSKKMPEMVKFFSKRNMYIKQVVMCKFHSIFLTRDGVAYSCGNGRGGRLGNGSEDVFIDPQLVDAGGSVITSASAGIDHSVFVTADGQLLTCGLNDHRTLGINPPPQKSLLPQRVSGLRDHIVVGCCAGSCHTVAWTSQSALYTFGTNAGQLGHGKGQPFIVQPRQVSSVHREEDKITYVHACDAATVVSTAHGVVFLLHNYICRKIVTKQMDIIKLQVGGGILDRTVISQMQNEAFFRKKKEENLDSEKKDVKVLLLKKSGDLLSWNSAHSSLDRCQFDQKQLSWISDVSLSCNGVAALLVSADGTAYTAKFQAWIAGKPARRGSALHKQEYLTSLDLMSSDAIQKFQLEQIPCAFRCHTAVLGPKGRNYSLLQSKPSNFLTQIPVVDAADISEEMKMLFESSDASDLLHDIVIHVRRDGKPDVLFPTHKFILASRSLLLSKLILSRIPSSDEASLDSEKDKLIVEGIHPKIFMNILSIIYTGSCEMLQPGSKVDDRYPDSGRVKIFWSDNTTSAMEIPTKSNQVKVECFTLLKILSNLFGIRDLSNEVFSLHGIRDGVISSKKSGKKLHFAPSSLPQLTDCEIESVDGLCFQAHKCILASRIPFFHGMLSSPWIETSLYESRLCAQLKVPVPGDVFKYILDFAYMDSSSSIRGATSVDGLCEVLAASDLLLMGRLKQIAEVQIAPLLTLKNVCMVAEVASAFNSNQLYESCLQFACHHLPALLHTPAFHYADEEFLDRMEVYYRSQIPDVYRRSSPPSMEGPDVSHIPEEDLSDDITEVDFSVERHSSELPTSSLRKRRTSEAHSSRKGKSKKAPGIMLSDLLNRKPKDEEDEILERIAPNQDQPLEKLKDDQKKNLSISPEATSPESQHSPNKVSTSESSKNLSISISPHSHQSQPAENLINGHKPTPVISPPAKNIHYGNHFPQLGGTVGTWPSLSNNTVNGDHSNIKPGTSASTVHSNRPKKLSQKERKRIKEKEAEEKKESLQSPSKVPNAWGVAARVPDSSENFWNAPSEHATSPKLSSPISSPTKPTTSNITSGPWQQLPSSPPLMKHPQSPSSPTSPMSPPRFMEIVENEQLSKERAEQTSKKPLSVIQLEDLAMEELKLHYEESRKRVRNNHQYFTVSRLPVDITRELLVKRRNK